ncbi:MAG: Ig-like domain-containing protein, partial [Thermoanaerobaculia bacterium]
NIDQIELPLEDEDLEPSPNFKVRLDKTTKKVTVTRSGETPKSFDVLNLRTGDKGTGNEATREISSPSQIGDRLLLTSSADSVFPTREIQVVFNEAIYFGDDAPAEDLKDYIWVEKKVVTTDTTTGTEVVTWEEVVKDLVEYELDSGGRRVTIKLPVELQRGETYRVVIQGTIQDQADPDQRKPLIGGTMHLPFSIRKPAGLLGGPFTLEKGAVRDIALDGNLFYVSALEGGLYAFDVSNPRTAVDPDAKPHAFTKPIPCCGLTPGAQWAVAVDHHGRVWTTAVNGMYGLIRSFRSENFMKQEYEYPDPPYPGAPAPPPVLKPVEPKSAAIVSWRPGINAGMPLGTTWSITSDRVEATPRELQVLTQDQRVIAIGGTDFAEKFTSPDDNILGASAVATGTSGEFRVYQFTIPKLDITPEGEPYKYRLQRATVENLTLGARWSGDIKFFTDPADSGVSPSPSQTELVLKNVLVRPGDKIRVTRNWATYGAVSLFGFGVGMFDLNAIESNHWHTKLPGDDYTKPAEQIMVTEARANPRCEDPNGPDGNPCLPQVLTYTPD